MIVSTNGWTNGEYIRAAKRLYWLSLILKEAYLIFIYDG